jgi:predicted O-linked N-acetylglucosamine transferase (SPINDLY family)
MQSMNLQQSLVAAMQHQQAGRLDEAEKLYRQILARHPDSADALHLLGVLCAQLGRHQEGVKLIRQAISHRPSVAGFHANLGHALFADKSFEEAVSAYQEAARLNPNDGELQIHLATSLKESGRLEEAATCARKVLRLNSKSAKAEFLLGAIMQDQGDLKEAAEAYERAGALEANSAPAQNHLGNVFRSMRRLEDAIIYYRRALGIKPEFTEAMSHLADALRDAGRFGEAIAAYQRVIALRPDSADSYNNLAVSLRGRRRFEEALTAIGKAIALRPDCALFWSNRGGLLRDVGKLLEAVAAIRRALQIDPNLFEAHLNLATNLVELGRVDQAMESARRCVELNPHSSEARNVLGNIFKDDGQVDKAIEQFDQGLELQPDSAMIHSNKVYVLEFDPRCDAKGMFAEARRWDQQHGQPMKKFIRAHQNDRSTDRPLRIGYVSPNFCNHAESFFTVPLMEKHDREQFEIHCYSDGSRIDALTERMKSCAHVWHISSGWTNEELAEQIRRDRIDILVDLSMHMTHNRLLTFAQKPAPVQLAWLAYPGGTGLDAMDYRVTDQWIDPPGGDESVYREQTIRLPETWVCYDPLCEMESAQLRADGPIRFGSINNPCKLNDPLLNLWARVMHAVPDSRLLLQAIDKGHRQRLAEFFQAAGIGGDRLEFLSRCPRTDYLRLYDRIDICLDPLPYNGITTTCDALWVGVPVISLVGQTAAGRGTASILANIGLSEFAARDPDQFIQIASVLAGDVPRLAELRRTLRDRFSHSPMMDAPRFAKAMEAAYRHMWRNWCDGRK